MSKDYVIIGSAAMKHHFPDYNRIPKDRDIIIKEKVYKSIISNKEDIEYIKDSESGISSIVKFKSITTPVEYFFSGKQKSLDMFLNNYSHNEYATIGQLYSFKKSHIHYPIKFDKHIKDFLLLREALREKYNISLEKDLNSITDLLDQEGILTEILKKDLEKRQGKLRTPKMNQTTEEFFGKSKNFVKSYYIHDNIHKAIAVLHKGSPVYEKIIKDGSQVETDITKWIKLTLEDKIFCVLEEVYTIALERKILPGIFGDKEIWDIKEAFDWALMRVCTTLCSGFFRDFATKAHDIVSSYYNPEYVNTFFKNISKFEK